jgi:enoyl-CoA hydratase/carnithine racemase
MTSEAAGRRPVGHHSADGIVTITLDRPERRNAVDAATTAALREAMDRFEADGEARVAILTGAGDRAFCAGMDLKAFLAGEGPEIIEGRGGFAGFTAYPRTKPVIAAVNGPALAGGCEIVLACDLVVMAEHATLGLPEVKRGLFAASGGALRLPGMIPRVRALELLLTGDPVDAATALALGLVNRVVPADGLLAEAMALAARIRENAPLAVRATLEVARAAAGPSSKQWRASDAAWARIAVSEDAREGPAAFAEKRPPRWRGR